MKIVISPAKSLNFESDLPTARGTQPKFLEQAEILNKNLSRKTKKEIGELMSISEKLADLNYQRYNDFEVPFTKSNARPAMYTFDGDVYTGLDAYTIPTEKLDKLQDSLRILSGLYGILRPLDLMQAYRLEMGTKLKIQRNENLYEFWGDTLTEALNKEMEEGELFINLASNEYFKVLQPKKLKVPVITPVFKDFKNGKLKIISFFAKKARGLMVRYIIDKDVKTIEDLKGFNYEDYGFSEEHSNLDKNELVFIR
ncbi:peroxide stress protein YaaA [Dokdonia sinensis]|uniref:UPF0246 protein EAX61_07285 n=1 Tax=Dokdonia sinensis TaxID=2479847 RepID=A0A3M0G6T7_9FLAO|nr:peroxide stress protein YaaA [Dokdonia sinensis]RMB60614.1 peroxide stress protein YaaA [Dokdonia sinensis]